MEIDQDVRSVPASEATSIAANTLGKRAAWRSRPVAFGGFLAVLIALFGRELFLLFTTAFQSNLNSYIVLVPFVAGYLLWLQHRRLSQPYASTIGWAILPLLLGSAALVVKLWQTSPLNFSVNDDLALVAFAFVCFVWAGGFLFLGKNWMKAAAFPMAFLVFLVPLPDATVNWLETGSRLASAEAASWFFGISGTPALRTGTVFQLPGFTIEVAPECSGIRSSWVLFITSLVAAHLFLATKWSRAILVTAVIPLGILRNGFRIMVIGLLCIHVDQDMINSALHRRGGPIFFALSLIPLWLLLWLLRSRDQLAQQRGETRQLPT
jgi:exosortase C (VPDSG-CTERM-specific)